MTAAQRNIAGFVGAVATVIAIALAIELTGGLPGQHAHFYYIPVVLSAFLLPRRLSLPVALLAAAAVSPLADVLHRPLGLDIYYSDATPWNLTTGGWIVRPLSFVAISLLIGKLVREKAANVTLEARFQRLLESAPDALVVVDGEGRIELVNLQTEKMFGHSRQELLGQPVEVLVPERFWGTHVGHRQGYGKEPRSRPMGAGLNLLARRKDGSEFPVEISLSPIQADGRLLVTSAVRDISERKRAEETIRRLAYHDALTGLPNRTLFMDHLTLALAQSRRSGQMLAVMFIDLDRFKLVNDTAGHREGDALLRGLAEQIKGLVREGDTVARVGGDEFTLLLPDVPQVSDAIQVAQRILDILRQPWVLADHEFHITPSIGVTFYPTEDGDSAEPVDAEMLLRNADIAMYRAKDGGGNRYQIHTPAMNASILERLALETDLRHGLEREEFMVYYQPQVSLSTGQIVGAEALVRWQHPERGLVMPLEFIHVAEETGLIVPLGEWVLRTACAQAKAWQDEGLPCTRIAVNLSARQFQQRDLAEKVAQVLRETGLGSCGLQLEITESVAIQDVDYTVLMLGQLKEMGIQIAIDDFGTGHSALSYLRRFPIDAVKIDRSFVRDLVASSGDTEIAAAVIVMAHTLKLDVIAEGVETEEQLAFLRQRRCDEMQGYLFSRPVPAMEFATLVGQARSLPPEPRQGKRRRASTPTKTP